jgi:hypothetical protein
MNEDPRRQDVAFRTLAAPGLDEDDLFAALQGMPPDALLGGGAPGQFGPPESVWDEAAERRRRHAELLSKWAPQPDACRPERRGPSPAR